MKLISVCRKCAEVHPAEIDCPACSGVPLPVRRDRDPVQIDLVAMGATERDDVKPWLGRRMPHASALLVSAYLVAVVLLLVAVLGQA